MGPRLDCPIKTCSKRALSDLASHLRRTHPDVDRKERLLLLREIRKQDKEPEPVEEKPNTDKALCFLQEVADDMIRELDAAREKENMSEKMEDLFGSETDEDTGNEERDMEIVSEEPDDFCEYHYQSDEEMKTDECGRDATEEIILEGAGAEESEKKFQDKTFYISLLLELASVSSHTETSKTNDRSNLAPPVINCMSATPSRPTQRKYASWLLRSHQRRNRYVGGTLSLLIHDMLSLCRKKSEQGGKIYRLLHLCLIYLCKSQRLWRAILRDIIFNDMGIPRRIIKKYVFRESGSRELFSFEEHCLRELNKIARRPLHFRDTTIPGIDEDTVLKKTCIQWITQGVGSSMEETMKESLADIDQDVSDLLPLPTMDMFMRKVIVRPHEPRLWLRLQRNLTMAKRTIYSALLSGVVERDILVSCQKLSHLLERSIRQIEK